MARALLVLGEMAQLDDRDGLQAKLRGGVPAGVTGDDSIGFVDQDRIDEAKFLDAVADLTDLLLRVGARVAWVGL